MLDRTLSATLSAMAVRSGGRTRMGRTGGLCTSTAASRCLSAQAMQRNDVPCSSGQRLAKVSRQASMRWLPLSLALQHKFAIGNAAQRSERSVACKRTGRVPHGFVVATAVHDVQGHALLVRGVVVLQEILRPDAV